MFRSLAALLVTLFVTGNVVSAAVTAWTDVSVRVYDAAGLDARMRQDALHLAGTALSTASVEVTWHVCVVATQSAPCDARLSPSELSVRIVHAPVQQEPAGTLRLGDAFIDTYAGRGVLATVYMDRILRLADQAGTEQQILLGHAIAHELGHLLMANSTHGPLGLMRAFWTPDEVRNNRPLDWRFAPRDATAIHLGAEANRTRAGGAGTN